MSSQQWPGSSVASSSQADNTSGLLPQYFGANNSNMINLAVKSEQPDTLGRFGRNRDYQMYSSPYWQRGVWEYTQEAIFSKDTVKVDLALKGLEFTFSHQFSNGSFSFAPVPGVSESSQQDVGLNGQSDIRATAFFMAALGTSLTTYQESGWFQTDPQNQSLRDRLTRLTPQIKKTLDFLEVDSNVSRLQRDTNDTNRIWQYALSYYGAGSFLGDAKAKQVGLSFAQKALSQFDPTTGIFRENGGSDSSYQAVNMVVASRFSFLLDKNDPLRAKIQQAVVAGAKWEQAQVSSTGEISTANNSRVHPLGESFMGQQKTVDRKQVVLALSYAALFSNDQTYWRTAERVSDFYNLNYTTPGVLSFSAPTFSLNEDGSLVSAVIVTRTGGSYGSVSATLSMNNGTAANSDYTKSPIVVAFGDRDAVSKVIQIPIADDNLRESNETIRLSLSKPQGRATLGVQRTTTLTIVDNDSLPTVTINPAALSQEEGNSGTSTFTFTVSLSHGSNQTILVPYITENGSAIAGSDYLASSGTLTFKPGEVSKKILITANKDTTVEQDETFRVKLDSPTNAILGANTQTSATIVNDDTVLEFSTPSFSVNEDGTAIDTITVTRSGSGKGIVSATLSMNNGTASDSDYTKSPIVVTFGDGDLVSKLIQIPIANDNLHESNETIKLSLSRPQGGATIGVQRTATLTVVDSDSPHLSLPGSGDSNATGDSLNNLLIGNSGHNSLAGVAGSDTLLGGAGNDTLNGGGGADSLVGGTGYDIYYVDSLSDIVEEASTISTEIDTVRAYVTHALGANLERLSLRGESDLNATGNNLNNLLGGNTGNNTLNGQAGNDTLIGYAGNDIFASASGNDTLIGGAGNDSFHYVTGAAFNTAAIGIDLITDFKRVAGNTDNIMLSKTTFNAGTDFASVGSDALAASSTSHITFSTGTGHLFYNQNGSAVGFGNGGQFATVSNVPTLLASDFTIVT
jgi:Ca2+-binding RTX toxin-like protein